MKNMIEKLIKFFKDHELTDEEFLKKEGLSIWYGWCSKISFKDAPSNIELKQRYLLRGFSDAHGRLSLIQWRVGGTWCTFETSSFARYEYISVADKRLKGILDRSEPPKDVLEQENDADAKHALMFSRP